YRPRHEGSRDPAHLTVLGRGSRLADDARPRIRPLESSARNTIETVFCLRRNHISGSALNATSQQMTNGRLVAARAVTGGQKGICYETMRPMSRKTRIRCPRP